MGYIDKSGYYQEFLKMQLEPLKPKHIFNEGRTATLCNKCGKMIWLGHTEDLYCEDCGIKIMEQVWREDDNNQYGIEGSILELLDEETKQDIRKHIDKQTKQRQGKS